MKSIYHSSLSFDFTFYAYNLLETANIAIGKSFLDLLMKISSTAFLFALIAFHTFNFKKYLIEAIYHCVSVTSSVAFCVRGKFENKICNEMITCLVLSKIGNGF